MSYEFLPVSTDNKAIKEIAGLMHIVFPKANKYSEAFIEWQYKNNPEGKVVGYNAYKNGVLVAHYALIPFIANVFGKEEKGLLSLNTATHPEHQGKKLFSTLADKTYQLAIEQGYGFVIGVANANSTPGFVNKLGFQLVGALVAKLGFGKIRRSAKNSSIQFVKNWNKEALVWRMANPESKYRISDNTLYTATDKVGIKAILLKLPEAISLNDNNMNIGFCPVNLWIGIDASINWAGSLYFNIPDSMRPSPLNFIFKDLTKENRKLDFKNVRFNAFDFDAY